MRVFKINQYEAYRADEQGVRFSINKPTDDTVYYKAEVESFDIDFPDGFHVVEDVFGMKYLRHGDDEVIIQEDEKGLYLLICDGSDKKVYITKQNRVMIPRLNYKQQVLKEHYNEYCSNSGDGHGDGMTFADYVKRESENDPDFWSWLYDEGLDSFEGFPDDKTMKENLQILINW